MPKRGGERYKAATETETNKASKKRAVYRSVWVHGKFEKERLVFTVVFRYVCVFSQCTYVCQLGNVPLASAGPNRITHLKHSQTLYIEFSCVPVSSHEFLLFS